MAGILKAEFNVLLSADCWRKLRNFWLWNIKAGVKDNLITDYRLVSGEKKNRIVLYLVIQFQRIKQVLLLSVWEFEISFSLSSET